MRGRRRLPLAAADPLFSRSALLAAAAVAGGAAPAGRPAQGGPAHPLQSAGGQPRLDLPRDIRARPHAIIKILQAVPWADRLAANEAYRLLEAADPLPPRDALELLDKKFADPRVRAFALRSLTLLSDNELEDYLLQMIQTLKYEPYHFGHLACFLLERAHGNRLRVGSSDAAAPRRAGLGLWLRVLIAISCCWTPTCAAAARRPTSC